MASAVRLREDYLGFGASGVGLAVEDRQPETTAFVAGCGQGWHGPWARRRRSARRTARRCVTGSIASTPRVWRASSTTGRRVPSHAFRRSNWLSSRRSSRRVQIVRRTTSCAGVRLDHKRVIAGEVRRRLSSALCRSSSRNSASPTSVRAPVIQLRTSGPSRLSKTYGPAPSAGGFVEIGC